MIRDYMTIPPADAVAARYTRHRKRRLIDSGAIIHEQTKHGGEDTRSARHRVHSHGSYDMEDGRRERRLIVVDCSAGNVRSRGTRSGCPGVRSPLGCKGGSTADRI